MIIVRNDALAVHELQLPFDVCNAYQECSRNILTVQVTAEASD